MKKKRHVLIVEDELSLGHTIQNLLRLHNFDVTYCSNGAEGIQKAFEIGPDIILCDIKMVPIDGYQVYSVLSESSFTNDIPFIFLTGKSDLEDIRMGLDLGVDDYIVKPFNNNNLVRTINKRIDKVEQLLHKGREEFHSLMKVSPNGIILFDDSYVYETNNSFSVLTGISSSNIISHNLLEFIDNRDRKKVEQEILLCHNKLKSYGNIKLRLINGVKCEFYTAVSKAVMGYRLMVGLFIKLDGSNFEFGSNYSDLLKVLKEEDIDLNIGLVEKIKDVFNNHELIETEALEQVKLSKRELEVLELSCEGFPIKIIADKLNISDRTVEKHRASLLEKTQTHNVVELIIFSIKNQLVSI